MKSLIYSEGVEGTSDRKGKWSFRIEAIEAHRSDRGNELRLLTHFGVFFYFFSPDFVSNIYSWIRAMNLVLVEC